MEWISVEDGLPEQGVLVLIYLSKSEEVTAAIYLNDKFHTDAWVSFSDVDYHTGNVTHWMPLPEPPKKD